MNDVDDAQAALERHADRLRSLSDEMAAIRVEERSAEGAVTVVVDGNGVLVDLRLSDAISQLRPSEFERILVTTAAAAARRAFKRQADLVTSFNNE